MKPAIVFIIMVLSAVPETMAVENPGQREILRPSTQSITGATLFTALIEHNLARSRRLHDFQVRRTYLVANDEHKPRAESEVLLSYQAPDRKEFSIISERGSGLVRRRVFKALLDSEVEAAAGTSKRNSSITPENYIFEYLGEEDVDGFHTFAVHAIPKRIDKYLFDAKIWIESKEFAIVRIEGQPAKSPSFWIKKVNFVRRYQRIDGFWLPLRDETVTDVRLVGKNIFTIDHHSYAVNRLSAPENEAALITTPVK